MPNLAVATLACWWRCNAAISVEVPARCDSKAGQFSIHQCDHPIVLGQMPSTCCSDRAIETPALLVRYFAASAPWQDHQLLPLVIGSPIKGLHILRRTMFVDARNQRHGQLPVRLCDEGPDQGLPGRAGGFKGITLSFLPGVKIGVLGVNGAGKSTLLKIMAGIETEYGGEAWARRGRARRLSGAGAAAGCRQDGRRERRGGVRRR